MELTSTADPNIVASVFGSPSEPATEAPAPDAAPTEQAPPPEPTPQPEPRVSAKIAAGLQAERRAAEARREKQEAEAARDAAKKEDGELRTMLAKLRSDPLAAIKALGYANTREFLETIAGHREPPADTTEREEIKAEQQRLAKEVETLRAERAEAEQRQTAAQQTQTQHRAVDQFVDMVGANNAQFPTLSADFTPNEIGQQAIDLMRQEGQAIAKRLGRAPNDAEIASVLEHRAKERQAARQAWAARHAPAAPPQSAASHGPQVIRPTPRTLDDRFASERASAAPDLDPDAESLRILKAAMRR